MVIGKNAGFLTCSCFFFFFNAFRHYNFDEGVPSFYIRIENRNHYETARLQKVFQVISNKSI